MARSPARIATMLSLVEIYWRKNPDLRLGQLIVNVAGTKDPFYVEDDALTRRLLELTGGRQPMPSPALHKVTPEVTPAQKLFLESLPIRESGVLSGSQTTMAHWLKSLGLVKTALVQLPGEALGVNCWVITTKGRAALGREG